MTHFPIEIMFIPFKFKCHVKFVSITLSDQYHTTPAFKRDSGGRWVHAFWLHRGLIRGGYLLLRLRWVRLHCHHRYLNITLNSSALKSCV